MPSGRIVAGDATRQLFDAAADGFVPAAIVARASLRPGDRVAGPAIVTERETTTIVTSGREAVMQADGCLLLSLTTA